jgi:hypothetical protein
MMSDPEVVRNLGDVANLPTDFTADQFEEIFFANFSETSVSVHSIISVVYVITRFLGHFVRDATDKRQTMVRLF